MGEHSSPPPLSPERSNMPMLYYGLVVVGTAAVVLAIYNLVIIKRCANRRRQRPNRRFLDTAATSQSFQNSSVILVSSFKYTKEAEGQEQHKRSSDYECAVCLSVFEDDEDVRKLPRCKHSFHAQCIDMWVYSHFDCPLCRSPVEPGVLPHQHRDSFEISRQGFLESGIPV